MRAKKPPPIDETSGRREIAVLLGAIATGAWLCLAFFQDLRHAIPFQQPVLDSLEYLLMARRIRDGHLLWNEVTIHAPLYAFWLAGLLRVFRDNLDSVRGA